MKDYQKLLFPFAYNILGSTEEAKDAIQDVISRHITSSRQLEIENIEGYLIRSVINQSINVKKRGSKIVSGRVTLPEPVATEKADTDLYLKDIVSYSMMILMDRLNVKERAVFILKEAFEYSHQEIAEALSSTVENSRKLLSRAREKLSKAHQSAQLQVEKQTNIQIDNYIKAIRRRDVKTLENLLTQDIVVVADGGDKVQVFRNITIGLTESIDLIINVFERFQQEQTICFAEMNHQPALLYFDGDRLETCQIFTIDDKDKITGIYNIVDPDKLQHIHLA